MSRARAKKRKAPPSGREGREAAAPLEASAPPIPTDRTSLKRARAMSREAARLLRRHEKALPPEQHRALTEAILALDEALADGTDEELVRTRAHALEERVDKFLGFARKSSGREFLESIVVALLIAGILRAFIIEPFKIPTGSMIPTLAVGDHIFVNKFLYGLKVPFINWWIVQWGQPSRGDVVVFRYPLDPSTDYIKRVVALAGDRVRVRGDDVFINGQRLEHTAKGPIEYIDPGESDDDFQTAFAYEERSAGGENSYTVLYKHGEREREPFPSPDDEPRAGLECTSHTTGDGECTVAQGYVFTMGDNRDNSSDGRVWGGVPLSHLEGKALFVWWSGTYSLDKGIRWKIRWDRLGTRVR